MGLLKAAWKQWTGKRETGARCQQWDVHILDTEYFFVAVNTRQYDCSQAAVRECESGRDYCAGDCCNVY
jgi:hypothetical protein